MFQTDPQDSASDQGRPILDLTLKFRKRIAGLALVSFVGAILEAGFLVLLTSTLLAVTQNVVDIKLPLVDASLSMGASLTTCFLAITVRLILSLIGSRLSASLVTVATTEVRQALSAAYLATSWPVQQAEPAGRLQELLTSFVSRVNATMTAITQGVTAGLSLTAFLLTGIIVNPLTTAAAIATLGGLAAVLAPLRRRARSLSGESAVANLEFASAVSELGALGQEMQTFGVQAQFGDRIDLLTERAAEAGRKVSVISGTLTPVYTFLAYIAILAGVTGLALTSYQSVDSIGSVLLLMLRSLSYGQQLVTVSGQIAASRPFLERVTETIRHYEVQRATNGSARLRQVSPVEARGVSYEYNPERPALHDVSFLIHAGEMVGVIGPSGSGKSTLAQLLLGLREPTAGRIAVAGVDLANVDRAWWTKNVAFVPQDPQLITGSVADNIRFFREGLDDEAIARAAKSANILTDISRLPHGFDTHLGERGGMLSGGQRQRLAIARALVGSPEVLVLDEPTSALDNESERLIRDTLAALHGDTIIVIIAHRMSSLDLCDRIMVFESGRLTGFETPAALLGSSEFYRRALQK